ncbi:hypothetical protein VPMS16_688 [Vibrio sp. 16]|nr:hypothetical protein VPMS16_688 [Vibrio sp. 16]
MNGTWVQVKSKAKSKINSEILTCDFQPVSNALLRGEQRNIEATAYHLNHLNQRIVEMPRVANPS